jgi:hypothetical protein
MFEALANSELARGTGTTASMTQLVPSDHHFLAPGFVQTLIRELALDAIFGGGDGDARQARRTAWRSHARRLAGPALRGVRSVMMPAVPAGARRSGSAVYPSRPQRAARRPLWPGQDGVAGAPPGFWWAPPSPAASLAARRDDWADGAGLLIAWLPTREGWLDMMQAR